MPYDKKKPKKKAGKKPAPMMMKMSPAQKKAMAKKMKGK